MKYVGSILCCIFMMKQDAEQLHFYTVHPIAWYFIKQFIVTFQKRGEADELPDENGCTTLKVLISIE